MSVADSRPLVVHVMHRFDVGGLENGVVNLINHMPSNVYRHAILALTEVTGFRKRIKRDDVEYFSLNKPPGHLYGFYPDLYRLFRRLRPAIVHSRNLAAMEVTAPAWAAGVPVRIHGEHGRDVGDLDGNNRTYQWLRRIYNPCVSHYIALSRDLERYLVDRVGIRASKVAQIYNGVDAERFHPATGQPMIDGCPFQRPEHWLVGSVGRMQTVKDQTSLVRAFIRTLRLEPSLKQRLRLILVGDGPLRDEARILLKQAGAADLAWLPGERNDVPEILRGLDCFVLPSLAEGISNTILEAMATGLPLIATRVGGNPELVSEGKTGQLVPAGDAESMARALIDYARHPGQAFAAGQAGRVEVEQHFSMEAMVGAYQGLYDRLLFGSRQDNQ
jgi:sugar transferase (PEP-CTERM/EpsH1 system associated)